MPKATSPTAFLAQLNRTYSRLHRTYERHFWTSYMGDHSVDEQKKQAQQALDSFRSDPERLATATALLAHATKAERERLQVWIDFFHLYQMPAEAQALKVKIDDLETKIAQIRTSQTEGYTDPDSGKFVPASTLKMRSLIRTHADEKVRRACYDAVELQADWHLPEYVELVRLRNQFARTLGYDDFYDYKLRHEERTSKDELFALFGSITDALRDVYAEVRQLAKSTRGLRRPWNFAYLMSGDFTKEEDQYFPFAQAVERWGRSFAAWGIQFQGGCLTLDLLDRKGKHNNGFCHWPDLVRFENSERIPGSANFTCNVVPGQVGSAYTGYLTLFHEGGHAAHFLNVEQPDVCLNHEYAPMTASWAEVHSMFLDSCMGSVEWLTRYAKNTDGEAYPFELYARKAHALAVLRPWRILSIIFVVEFERAVYEMKDPTPEKLKQLAKQYHRRYFDQTEGSLLALNIPHLYAWESACSYHGYGLAEIAVHQWQEYFYAKYGYIVDNPKVGKEMQRTWAWGAKKPYAEAVREATGKPVSSKAIIKNLTRSPEAILRRAKKRLKRMESVSKYKKPVDLNASIRLVHGKKTIATNASGFDAMSKKYARWVARQEQ